MIHFVGQCEENIGDILCQRQTCPCGVSLARYYTVFDELSAHNECHPVVVRGLSPLWALQTKLDCLCQQSRSFEEHGMTAHVGAGTRVHARLPGNRWAVDKHWHRIEWIIEVSSTSHRGLRRRQQPIVVLYDDVAPITRMQDNGVSIRRHSRVYSVGIAHALSLCQIFLSHIDLVVLLSQLWINVHSACHTALSTERYTQGNLWCTWVATSWTSKSTSMLFFTLDWIIMLMRTVSYLIGTMRLLLLTHYPSVTTDYRVPIESC